MGQTFSALLFLALFLIAFVVYFLPLWIAAFRRHRNVLGILILNLFLGWSVIGWIVALVWAVYQERTSARS